MMLPADFKSHLMTSICLQITKMVYDNMAVSDLRKVAVAGDISVVDYAKDGGEELFPKMHYVL